MKRMASYLPLLLFSFSIFCGIFSSSSIDSYALSNRLGSYTFSNPSFTWYLRSIDTTNAILDHKYILNYQDTSSFSGSGSGFFTGSSSSYGNVSGGVYDQNLRDSAIYCYDSNIKTFFVTLDQLGFSVDDINPDSFYRLKLNVSNLGYSFFELSFFRDTEGSHDVQYGPDCFYFYMFGDDLINAFNDYGRISFSCQIRLFLNGNSNKEPSINTSFSNFTFSVTETDYHFGNYTYDRSLNESFNEFSETFNDRFIPSDGSSGSADGHPSGENNAFGGVYSTLYDTMEEKLGFLSFPFMLLVSLLEGISSDGSFSGITFPEISWQGQVIIPETLVTFPDIGIQDTIYFVTDIVLIGWFIILLQNKLREVLTK